jgi:hypothetical protein
LIASELELFVTIGTSVRNIDGVQGGPEREPGRDDRGGAPSTGGYRRLADGFTTRLDLLMHSKRLLLARRERESEAPDADRLRHELAALQERRDYWVMRCSPDDPRFWIGAYGRLLGLYDRAIQQSPPSADAVHLQQAASQYRERLQGWRRKAAE